jgi:hypothetical protein
MITLRTDINVTELVNADFKSLEIERQETKNNHTGDLVEHSGLFFRKVARFSYDAPSLNF